MTTTRLSCVRTAMATIAAGACITGAALAQRAGESATVQFGVVKTAQPIELTSDAARGALVGGTLGLASAGGRSTSRTVRNSIVGATVGAAATAAAEGSRSGMSYTVQKVDGATVTVVTDQRDVRVGDCVAVERVGQTANIRRTSDSYCDRKNEQARASVASHSQSEAIACASAKQELVDAQTTEAVDLAARKIELLCNG